MQEASAIERAAATLKALAATRVAETSSWKGDGDASAARFVARKTGTSVSAAADAIKTAERLKELPEADAAARNGELSPEQASAIASGASADPGAEKKLVETARRSSLQELRNEAARVRAAAEGEDGEARRARIHARRSLREWTDIEGMWHLHAQNNPEVGARIMAVLRAKADEIFRRARAEGRGEPAEAYGADALDEVIGAYGADGQAGDSTPRRRSRVVYKVITRIDFAALLRGRALGAEVCEIAGFGPVPVSAVREMLTSGNAILAAVVTDGVKVTGVAHLRRKANAWVQTALEWLYPTCAVEGCSATARLQNDHRDDWAKTHITAFDGLDRYCPPHHDRKTRENWALVEGVGKRAFVPPSDPRHPHQARSQERPPPAANDPPEAA